MTDLTDQAMLVKLTGDQKCACCGIEPLSPESCDVVDGEVTCMDCLVAYYPNVYARRSGEQP